MGPDPGVRSNLSSAGPSGRVADGGPGGPSVPSVFRKDPSITVTTQLQESERRNRQSARRGRHRGPGSSESFERGFEALAGLAVSGVQVSARATDLETAWDDAASSLQAKNPDRWTALDGRVDAVLKSVRASTPDSGREMSSVDALLTALNA